MEKVGSKRKEERVVVDLKGKLVRQTWPACALDDKVIVWFFSPVFSRAYQIVS
jgi:hypothetical protein